MTAPLAELFVEGLRVICIVGDLPHERTEPQQILIHLRARIDPERVSASDQLEDSVDYVAMADLAMRIAQEGKFRLVETLAMSIARTHMEQWPSILEVHVRIDKEGCIPHARACGVQVRLDRTS